MSIFFTADTHFGHAKIIEHAKRPFATVGEMDEVLINRWNAVVRPNDDIWHLGDFAFRCERIGKTASDYFVRLNGRIHVVWGNHDDKDAKLIKHLFASHQEVKYLRLEKEKITLYHYAQRVWRNSHRGSWHLYGHSHGMLPHFHRSMDVGVDVWNFAPVPFDVVRAYMIQQPVTLHHPELVSDPWDKS